MTERSGLLEERRVFAALVDLLLPASGDGRMPAASELGLPDRWRGETPGAGEGLASIAAEARTRIRREFPDLAAAEQADVVAALGRRRWRSFTPLATAIFEWYDQQDRVLAALGCGARAPFPEGYRVEQGDLTLLESVYDRGRIYRDP